VQQFLTEAVADGCERKTMVCVKLLALIIQESEKAGDGGLVALKALGRREFIKLNFNASNGQIPAMGSMGYNTF